MLHVIGFYHEQSRYDRDEHVKINYENIPAEKNINFLKENELNLTTSGTPYDIRSIMHYGGSSHSKNGKETITVLQGDQSEIGQRKGFSRIDKLEVERFYGCIKRDYSKT
jgi:hypothetical protein